jgi:hypothetical protein
MAQRRKRSSKADEEQLTLDFTAVLEAATVQSREEVAGQVLPAADVYDPVARTADYMRRAVEFEEAWGTTIQQARDNLLGASAVQLYLDFFQDLAKSINDNARNAPRLADLLRNVAIRGFGMSSQHIQISDPPRGGTRWSVTLRTKAVREHLEQHIVGDCFLNELEASDARWAGRTPLIGSSDVSQHTSAVPVPARFFRRSVPFVLNNAAGSVFSLQGAAAKYENVYNPKPDESFLRWMLIDPSYQDELEQEDYKRCLASAMDVGQYKFDLDYLLKSDKRRPDLVLRDGSLFPSDAYLDNYAIENRRGAFTRDAIREMLDCLSYARLIPVIYCGVSKNVMLKVYSSLVDWFIARHIDKNWDIGTYTLNDGQAMSLLLSSPSFVQEDLKKVVSTCLIRRSFTTRANLNTRVAPGRLEEHFNQFQQAHECDIMPYRKLCEIAHVYMYFMGHSKSPQQQLPRYEFFHHPDLGPPEDAAEAILAGVRKCSLMADHDHSFMSDAPVTYLLPAVTQQAHELSKNVGKHIDSMTGQWIMAKYREYLDRMRKK